MHVEHSTTSNHIICNTCFCCALLLSHYQDAFPKSTNSNSKVHIWQRFPYFHNASEEISFLLLLSHSFRGAHCSHATGRCQDVLLATAGCCHGLQAAAPRLVSTTPALSESDSIPHHGAIYTALYSEHAIVSNSFSSSGSGGRRNCTVARGSTCAPGNVFFAYSSIERQQAAAIATPILTGAPNTLQQRSRCSSGKGLQAKTLLLHILADQSFIRSFLTSYQTATKLHRATVLLSNMLTLI